MKVNQVIFFSMLVVLALKVRVSVFGQSINNQIQTIQEERVISEFHTLHVSGLAVVYLAPAGDLKKAKLAVSGMPRTDVLTTVNDGILTVTTQGIHNGENIKVYVSSPAVKAISVSGAGILYSQDTIKTDKLSIAVIGNGAAQLAVKVKELEINMNGGDLKISGQAKRQLIKNLEGYDHGTLDMSDLTVEK